MSRNGSDKEEAKKSRCKDEEEGSYLTEEECSDRLGDGRKREKKKGARAASMHTMVLGMDAAEEVEADAHDDAEDGGGTSASARRGRQRWRSWWGGFNANRDWGGQRFSASMEGGDENGGKILKENFDESLLQQAEEQGNGAEGESRYCPPALEQSASRETPSQPQLPREEEGVMDACSFFYDGFDDELSRRRSLAPAPAYSFADQQDQHQQKHRQYARERSRAAFLAVHNNLNATMPPSFSHLGDSEHSAPAAPPSSPPPDQNFRPHVRGKAHPIHRTTDYVRLVMDPFLEPGILSVEHPRSASHYNPSRPLEPLRYVLTVDEHLYRRVVREIDQSQATPCGLYYCCHDDTDSNRASISVAVLLLALVFLFLLVNTLIWPLD
uniref:Uncharacterized protein n=1 Tax=Helicotheca tamesis TaxID=374047 RepID=A0A7S2MG41_9STRA|mmetsp:Transcript_15532/g.21205  ORF Transcript_15532/g.21205 Transcript_15532/m.21205 type:complete len:383 (+) Transcript_15532:72-1220(+)